MSDDRPTEQVRLTLEVQGNEYSVMKVVPSEFIQELGLRTFIINTLMSQLMNEYVDNQIRESQTGS